MKTCGYLSLAAIFAFTLLLASTPVTADDEQTPEPPTFEQLRSSDEFNAETAKKIVDQFGVEKIVFAERATFQSSHYYTDYIDGCRFFGTDLCILDLTTGEKTSILPEDMKDGIINRLDVSFDADRVVFDWKPDDKSGFHVWEINIDGTGIHQITFPPEDEAETQDKYHLFRDETWHWISFPYAYPVEFGVYGHWTDDMHPCYLPDDGIAFISTRCRYGILCDGPDDLSTTVLYRINRDGSDLQKLTNSSVSEANPTLTEDGRILYTRWEYIDKGASCVKCIWAMRPDGTASAEVYGNDLHLPPSIIHSRQVPGESQLYVATAAPHCPNTGVGGIIAIDTTKDIRLPVAMELMTPETWIHAEGWFEHPENAEIKDNDELRMARAKGPHFADPYPFDRTTLLMSCQPSRDLTWLQPDGYGVYLYEGAGVYSPLFEATGTSCWGAQPLIPRERPPVLETPRDPTLAEQTLEGQALAVCLVTDIYHGLDGIERGEAKYIRINEQVPRPWAARRTWGDVWIDNYDQQHSPVGATHLGLKTQWGIVPIEEDGSAHFYVPADRNIFFQVLDKDYQELQRERTYVNYRPGETRSCIGCHETPQDAPMGMTANLLAMRRAPSMPGPQPGEETGRRPLDFEVDVQPILDRHCADCHDGDNEDSDLVLTDMKTKIFNLAYENLVGFKCSNDESYSVTRRDIVGLLIREIRPKVGNAEYLPPLSVGSPTSELVALLREDHYDVKLSEEEMIRITTWIDSNCQYYGSYWGRKNVEYIDHPNFRPKVSFGEVLSTECPIPEEDR
jgi:hypothetical protein